MNLELDTFEFETDLDIGKVLVEQLGNSTKVGVTLIPNNQTKKEDFYKVYDILELVVRNGYNLDFPMPENTTEDDLAGLSMAVLKTVDDMLETILNLQDFKDTTVNFRGNNIKVYPILEKLRRNYLKREISNFIQYRSTPQVELLPLSVPTVRLEAMFRAIDTINETDEARTKSLIEVSNKPIGELPYQVTSEYQVISYVGDNLDEVDTVYHMPRYEAAKDIYEQEVLRAEGNYIVELVQVLEFMYHESDTKTETQYTTISINK